MTGDDLLGVLDGIAGRISDDMSERDVENTFLNEGFFTELGYKGAGQDVRSELSLADQRRPDYITLDDHDRVTAVYEFKAAGRNLSGHEEQLFHYMHALKSRYGVLTNGQSLELYKREDQEIEAAGSIAISVAETSHARLLSETLRKPQWHPTDPAFVEELISDVEPISLSSDLGQEHFFDTFRLEEGSTFADLVLASMDLLAELRDEVGSRFVEGAYTFWERSFSRIPDDVPNSWEGFVDGEDDLRDFMFSLETAHALLGRLLLAKACEDHDFLPERFGIERQLDVGGFGGEIALEAYPAAADSLLKDMRQHLVESLFDNDIFIWWVEAFGDRIDSAPEVVATEVNPGVRDTFSRAVARTMFALLKFDFSEISGDPLGDLYQRYFDPETRKALGEFYTPKPVVNFILDRVGYQAGISNKRLIDPACGSGTFLVEAVDRYLEDVRRYEDQPDWANELTELCVRPHIVGLDIHPFAVLMAQIRFMVAILPAYKQAKQQDSTFTIRRLPIFRTDSLYDERGMSDDTEDDQEEEDQPTQVSLEVYEESGDIHIPIPLPLTAEGEEGDDEFVTKDIRMPLYRKIRTETGLRNLEEYFAAMQGVLDVVKLHMNTGRWTYRSGLNRQIQRYLQRDPDRVAEFFEPYVDEILETVKHLRDEHGDGRLVKMFEDSVLSLVVKDHIDYDFVVANPPYVNIKNIPKAQQKTYRELYDSAYGRLDLYVLFMERGLEWLADDGALGYITSNKFTRSQYGKEIRRIISTDYGLQSFIDFGDTEIFEDVTNYPCILFAGNGPGPENIPYAKVHQPVNDVLGKIDEHLGEEWITESIEMSTFPASELGTETWSFTPENTRRIFEKTKERAEETVGEVCLKPRSGVASNADEAFVVTEEVAEQKDLERELLFPMIRGKYTRRWIVEWTGDLAIYPYDENENHIDPSEYPRIKAHLDEHEEELRERYCVETGGKGIYEYDGPRPKSVYEGDFRIPVPDLATENHFAYADGYKCFKNTCYVLTFSEDQPYSEKELLGLLNSSVAELAIKQMSPFVSARYYRYKTNYLEKIPLPGPGSGVEEIVEEILEAERLSRKVEEFPASYVQDIDSEVMAIEYEWQTRRKPVQAEIEEREDGTHAITAGRTDEITDPSIASREHAEYVYGAVNGKEVDKGEHQSILIPRREEDVEKLLEAWRKDQAEVRTTDVEALEEKIDDIVFDLFGLEDEEREIVNDFLKTS